MTMSSFTMPLKKSLCSALLLAICLSPAESRSLKQWDGMPENPTPCLTADECREKFLSMNTGGYFYVIDRPFKGCMLKNANGYFASGGTLEQMSTTDLPGIQERIWCGETWAKGEEEGSMSLDFEESMSLASNEFEFDLDSMSMSVSMSFPEFEVLPEGPDRVSLNSILNHQFILVSDLTYYFQFRPDICPFTASTKIAS